jgi:4-aminobutyrate aminotransferase-like enzyme/Ser/Thr protein kinase RdoA (MazF antagonist)
MELSEQQIEQVRRAALRLAGVTGPVVGLGGEHDLNARVGDHLVKIHPSDADVAVLALQDAALRHLAGTDARDRVPAVVASFLDGDGDGDGDRAAERARVLTWLPGRLWREQPNPSVELRKDLGRVVAGVDAALAGLTHPAAARTLDWNLLEAPALLPRVAAVADPQRRALAERTLRRHVERVARRLRELPVQLIHNDANDYNVVLDDAGGVRGLIDFGDMVTAPKVCGLAIACAYAAFSQGNPVRDVAPVVAGYHEVTPLSPGELELLLDLMRTRLAASVVMAAWQSRDQPANAHLLTSHDDAYRVLQRLDGESEVLALCRFRDACGYDPHPRSREVRNWLSSGAAAVAPVLARPLAELPRLTLDWTAGNPDAPTSPADVELRMAQVGADVAIGRYAEDRAVYRTPAITDPEGGAPRTVHLGVDLFAPAGTPVRTPLDGVIHAFHDNAAPLDYGPVVIIEHRTDRGVPFYTLYGHLSRESLAGKVLGAPVRAGDEVATMGVEEVNGGWAPHVHFQLLVDLVGLDVDVPGVAPQDELAVWRSLSPDPNLLLRDPSGLVAPAEVSTGEVAAARRTTLSRSLSLSYSEPLRMVRGEGCWLYDDDGRRYLDLVNNVAHVGHCHPRVVAALNQQQAVLNTNTRYLHDGLTRYARRLADSLPDPLSVVFLTNSGSEANDLALRLLRAHTGGRDLLVLDHAYHGNLSSLVDISPYKFDGPGGSGRPDHTHVVTLPDAFRRPLGPTADRYVEQVVARLDEVRAAGRRVGGFISEPVPGTAGQVVLVDGFLAGAFDAVRAAGGLCVADEVQIGFGRVGAHRWGFELHGVVPDIVTMGKPIGNGHPLGAVVTTPEVARSFANGMEYFNTFGGNPVSAAAGAAVIDVVEDEGLQANAAATGRLLADGLRLLADRHSLVADVRGAGLFLGVELVDEDGRTPAADQARAVAERMRVDGVLISTDGPDHNVLKIKPPLVIGADEVELCLQTLDAALAAVTSTS